MHRAYNGTPAASGTPAAPKVEGRVAVTVAALYTTSGRRRSIVTCTPYLSQASQANVHQTNHCEHRHGRVAKLLLVHGA